MTKPDPEMIDDDVPELGAEFFAQARPTAEVHGEAFVEAARNKGGRPRKEAPKRGTSMRFDGDVLDRLEKLPGWRQRVNDAVRGLLDAGKL